MVYHTSDLHLDNRNLTRWRTRLEEDFVPYMIREWNKTVFPIDTVLILGDLADDYELALDTMKKLNGRKILVLGNHDMRFRDKYEKSGLFRKVLIELAYIDKKYENILCTHKYRKVHYGYCLLFGHTHTYLEANKYDRYMRDTMAYNVSLDLNKFRPVTLEEVISNKYMDLQYYFDFRKKGKL